MSESPPQGIVPRVEAQWSHHQFVRTVSPSYAMMKLNHARRLVKREETADSYFGEETDVITTTTIQDDVLELVPWEWERDFIEYLEPAFHIPTDYPVYREGQTKEKRIENVESCMDGAEWMQEELSETPTEIIPLLKGVTETEREHCYERYDALGVDYCAYYATQYFTSGRGILIDELIDDLSQIQRESDVSILLIGLLSPEYLGRVPENVVGAAGQNQWRTRITPRKQTPEEMVRRYGALESEVNSALRGDA